LGLSATLFSQNPHGASLKYDCAACHTSAGWEIPRDYWKNNELVKPQISKTTGLPLPADTLRFHHGRTIFPLQGGHTAVDCRSCHQTLVFSEANSDCISCHTDIHQQTVGNDCARCHTPNNWLVDNITELHQENGFPLTGVHTTVSCNACHLSESELRFDRIGNDCKSCHLEDFNNTTNPNHTEAGFSNDCLECHDLHTPDWETDKVNHDFFPLTKGHEIADCAKCHIGGDFANTPNTCVACHLPDFEGTQNPNHVVAHFSNDCTLCHTTDPDWVPAQYTQHDAEYFPIYSGKHQGQWSECADCHTNASNYAEFSCTVCHLNPETDDGHDGVSGYVYENSACLACHPAGDVETSFDHNESDFPLTGAHITTDCIACHAGGYAGTPTDCASCHTDNFNQTSNPDHGSIGLSTDCASCHTTGPGWAPATFANHNDYYALNGAHAAIANDCATCHNGDYNNTPNTCAGCHTPEFNQTTDPNHAANQFPTDCATCHTESAWAPSTFDHSAIYPFTGAHVAIADDCVACHNGDYTNTPNTCAGCHTPDYNQSTNPNHVALNFPTDCASCHTTAPDWAPATFAIHNDYYPLNGAHAAIANDCVACHNGDYNNTPNTCFGCHSTDYNATTDPNHLALQFSTDCQSCHTETTWTPSTFDHDGQHFPIYSGEHNGEWNACADCHTNLSDYSVFTCTTCHANPETDDQHVAVSGYTFTSPACLACHPTGDATNIFDHNTTDFPLTGAHLTTDCIACHAGGYAGTPTDCASCHAADFNQTANPNHVSLGLSTDCASCHTTAPGWTPATFANHNDFYALNGAHIPIANDCAACHNGDYNNTPNTCAGCHTTDFNQTTDPNHAANQFPTDCATCHTESAWAPSTFNHSAIYPFTGAHVAIADDCVACHHGDYANTPNTCAGCHTTDYNQSTNPNHVALNFPTDCESCHTTAPDWAPATFAIHNDYYALNGAHAVIANDCAACHNGDYNNTPNTCIGCHTADYNATTAPNHAVAQFPSDCTGCHSETTWAPATFDHDGQYFPIYSGAHNGEWSACVDCHTNPTNYAEFTCTTCHANPETDDQHVAVGGYTFNSPACLACHPTGDATNIFDHNTTDFPLTGAHLTTECIACHAGGYAGTPTDCASCHTTDFNQTANPNHVSLGLSTDCASCHTTAPGWAPATFAVHDDYYALTGAHTPIANDCAACHNGDYTNTPNTCAGCHTTDYNQSLNPNHTALGLSADCSSCHTTAPGWAPATFAVHNDYYPLNGAHAAIANDCAACHNGNYTNTPNTCAGCHQADYVATTDPDHSANQFPTNCEICHGESAWAPSMFDHNAIYPFTGAHIPIAADCNACHNGDYVNTPNTCAGCHQTDYNSSLNPNHAVLGLPTDCEMCHTTDPGWDPATFPIHNDFYVLNGAHLPIANDCAACHNGNYNNTPNTCAGCHQADYNAAVNPNHVAAQFPTTCADCHSESNWSPSTFDHSAFYPFNGAHIAIANDCNACHQGNYTNTPNTCVGCHLTDFNATTDPNHAANQFPTTCESCHSESAWAPSTFDHSAIYPFTGAHIPIANDCEACHNGDYVNTPNTCVGCHQTDFNSSTNPGHVALGLPTDCEMCHTTAPDWDPATFPIHNNFHVLNGAHIPISNDCAACHNGNYNNTPNTCAGCHQADYNATSNPNHLAAQFPTTCADCHTESNWTPSTFNHNAFYPFNGAHLAIANDCNACHQGNYTNTPNTCVGCHLSDYNTTSNPNHAAAQFPTNCESCHSESAWIPATFDHSAIYPFTGAHISIANDCEACHHGNYTNTPNTCSGCHQTDYNGSTNPSHVALGLPTDCAMCHTTTPGWDPATFPIHNNYYALNGAHAAIANDCATCHNGNYNNTPNTCAGCHQADYNATLNPNHAAAQFPLTCADCHSENAWVPSSFNHNAFYPFTGAHIPIANDCNACHQGDYVNTPNTCVGCHQSDFNTSINPNHVALGIPNDCAMCHTTNPDWDPATFPIHNNYWVLNGAHAAIANDCAACHNGNYNNTPSTCVGCHLAEYNSANNPNHIAAGFPTDCIACHGINAWQPATFDHDDQYFPIYSGKHDGEWDQCIECHTTPGNFTLFSCIQCHEHDNPGDLADDHEDVSGYQYNSQACFACHPDGED